MGHEFTVTVNLRHLKRAYGLYWRRRLLRRYLLALGLSVGYFCLLFFTGTSSWLLGGAGLLVFLCAMWPSVSYLKQMRTSRAFLDMLDNGAINFVLSDETLRVSHALASSESHWEIIAGILKSRDIWVLLMRGRPGFILLPPDQAPEDALIFLTSAVVSHGGKVDGKP